MDNKTIKLFGLLAFIVLIVNGILLSGALADSADLNKTSKLSALHPENYLSFYKVINDFGPPLKNPYEIMEFCFFEMYAGLTVEVNITLYDAILVSALSYWRMTPYEAEESTSYQSLTYTDDATIIRFGLTDRFSFTIDERADRRNPVVLFFVVQSMAYDLIKPAHSGMISVTVL